MPHFRFDRLTVEFALPLHKQTRAPDSIPACFGFTKKKTEYDPASTESASVQFLIQGGQWVSILLVRLCFFGYERAVQWRYIITIQP